MFKKVLTVNGDTLTIPELKRFAGKKVEITIKEFFGTLEPAGDPLEYQTKARAEWNEREKSFSDRGKLSNIL